MTLWLVLWAGNKWRSDGHPLTLFSWGLFVSSGEVSFIPVSQSNILSIPPHRFTPIRDLNNVNGDASLKKERPRKAPTEQNTQLTFSSSSVSQVRKLDASPFAVRSGVSTSCNFSARVLCDRCRTQQLQASKGLLSAPKVSFWFSANEHVRPETRSSSESRALTQVSAVKLSLHT